MIACQVLLLLVLTAASLAIPAVRHREPRLAAAAAVDAVPSSPSEQRPVDTGDFPAADYEDAADGGDDMAAAATLIFRPLFAYRQRQRYGRR